MKKTAVFLLAILISLFLVSCTNEKTTNKEIGSIDSVEQNNKISITDTKEEIPKVVESIKKETQEIKNNSIENSSQMGKNIYSFMPNGWSILEVFSGKQALVEGDLNTDGTSDIAAVIQGSKGEEEAPPRAIIIAFGNKDNSYTLSVKAEDAILRANEGGMFGDPFYEIKIDRGSILIHYYGGSAWRWENIYRFRYQNGGWYMIGATERYGHTSTNIGSFEDDYNLLTGDYIRKETGEDGITKTTKTNRGKRKLVNLLEFNPRLQEKQF